MFNRSDVSRDAFMLRKGLSRCGYDWWWHSFSGLNEKTGEKKSFFIEFFTCNPVLGGKNPVFGQKKEKEDTLIKPSYLMVKAGAWGKDHVQLHRFFGWDDVDIPHTIPFSITASDCFLDEKSTKGHVTVTSEDAKNHPEYMCDSGDMSWELEIEKKTAFNVGYGASRPMRASNAFEMFWHAQGMKTKYKGYVVLNGVKYNVTPEECYGYADKNWGKNFTSPWVWLSSNNLKSVITGRQLENSVFDIGGGRPKIGPFALHRKLLSAYWYEGKCYEFNFSKFWTFTHTHFDCKETDSLIVWHVEQKTLTHRMVTDITCEKENMLLVNYEAPDGTKLHKRLWNGGNGKGTVKLYKGKKLIDEVEAYDVGCEYGEYERNK